jgi:hypothetical protein
MKKFTLLIVLLFIVSFMIAKTVTVSDFQNSITVIRSNENETVIDYKIGKFDATSININGTEYNKITVKNGHSLYKKGIPDLPVITKSIIIPPMAKMQSRVLESDFVDIPMKIAPSKGKILRNQNPADVPYEFSDVYNQNDFYPSQISNLGKPYILRDYRGITVNVAAFHYNPVTQMLRVYTHLKIKIKNVGTDTENILSNSKNSYSKYFESIYSHHFINFNSAKYDLVDEHGRMIVICYPDFMDAIQPYVEWKKQKGIDVQVYDVSQIGGANDILDFIQAQYDQNDDLTFVQLVGDAPAQVPTLTSGGGGADPKYALVAGNDHYVDLFVGRFSAETVAQVETQVQRTIWYEKEIQDGDWIQKGVGIASDQGPGDDNEYDYQHQDVIRNKLLGYGYTQVDQLYDTVGATAQDVTNALNEGRGILNYTGHGSDTSWGTTGFNINDVNQLQNDYMLPFIQSVACVVGNFVNQTCFAESWLRATHNGNPTGAIAFFGSTINQSWNPPMCAQDEYIDILTGNGNYDGTPEVMKTIGGLWFNGEGEMLDEYNDYAMSETWHIFGDASLMVRTKTPQNMVVSHLGTLFIGMNTYTVNTDTPDAQVTLYHDGIIYATGYTDATGNITLTLDNPPDTPMDLELTITAFNKVTYIDTINVVPSDGPYVLISSYTVSTSNGDDVIEYGETVNMSVTLQNVGSEDAHNVVLDVQQPGNFITIVDGNENFGSIPANQSVTVENCISFTVANGVPDNTTIILPSTISATEDNWTNQISITAFAPVLSIDSVTINDGENGRLDPGETADLIVNLKNNGGALLTNINATLTCGDQMITINSSDATLDQIAAGAIGHVIFNVSVDENTEVGHMSLFDFSLNGANDYSFADQFTEIVGLVLEDFETGDFSAFDWEFNDFPWQITDQAFEGNYAAVSADIDDGASTSMQVTLNIANGGEISFYYKVSSEANYDFFHFYIDDVEQDSWSGDIDWTQATYNVSMGEHTFKWEYEKDGSVSNGSDCAWLDYIVFPSVGEIVPPDFVITPDSIEVSLAQNGSAQRTITLANNGGGVVNYSLSIFTTRDRSIDGSTLTCDLSSYTPGNSYTLTFTVTNGSSDAEWLTDISIAFPAGVIVNGSTDFEGGSAPLVTNNETGDGVTVTWIDPEGGYGNIHGNESATATVDITVSSGFGGDMTLNWHLVGDQWGSDPHELDGQIVIPQEGEAITWISLSETSGSVGANESHDVIVYFNSNDLEWGNIYSCEIHVTDDLGRNVTVIPVTLNYNGDDFNNNNIIPLKNELAANYPNPFNPTTTIKYGLKSDSNVNLAIYNLKGQLVKTLVNKHQKAGYHKIVWNGKDNNGKTASSGVYFFRIKAGKFTSTKKMIMLK